MSSPLIPAVRLAPPKPHGMKMGGVDPQGKSRHYYKNMDSDARYAETTHVHSAAWDSFASHWLQGQMVTKR